MNKREIGKLDEIRALNAIASFGWLTKGLIAKTLWPFANNVKTKEKQALRLLYRLEKLGLVKARQLFISLGGGIEEAERKAGRQIAWILTEEGAEIANFKLDRIRPGNDRPWIKDGFDLSTLNAEKHIAFCKRAIAELAKGNEVWGSRELDKKINHRELRKANFLIFSSDYTKCTALVLTSRKSSLDKVKLGQLPNGYKWKVEYIALR